MNMSFADFMNNTKTRRRDSMLQRLSRIKYFMVFLVLLALPMLIFPTQTKAGITEDDSYGTGQSLIDQTDMGAYRLVYFADKRDRETLIQVTNTTTKALNIHVQLFDINNGVNECGECDFPDMLTGQDTHVYDVTNMIKNTGGEPQCGLPDGHHGFVVISFDSFKDGSGVCGGNGVGADDKCFVVGGPMIGMFRVIDDSGYEYRTNAAGKDMNSLFRRYGDDEALYAGQGGRNFNELINFELADGNNLSDLVGITFWEDGHASVDASPLVGARFGGRDRITIYDEHEGPASCSATTFSCARGDVEGWGLDKGIDRSLPSSHGLINNICDTNRLPVNSSGWIHMPFDGFACRPPFGDADDFRCNKNIKRNAFFVGFIGLNNGDGTGSMDSWWAQRPESRRKFHYGGK
jgi:hypothetical protein